jgi:cytochrome c553
MPTRAWRRRLATLAAMAAVSAATLAAPAAWAQAAKPALGIPSAAEAVAFIARTDFGGNAAAGKKLAETQCVACHGVDGQTKNFPAYPRLAGQLQGYIYMQLAFFATGERQHPIMSTQIVGLTNQQLLDVAAHFSSVPGMTPMVSTATPAELALGEKLFRKGALERGIPACASCHGPAGKGQLPAFSRIGGQHPQYMQSMLKLFQERSEFTTPYAWVMNSVASKLTAPEIKAVTEYASTLK